MEYVLKKNENNHLLILVHGLNGSRNSWEGSKERFVENLLQEPLIQENYNIALFTYPTNIFTITWLKKIKNLAKGFFHNRPKEKLNGFNNRIKIISDTLESEVRELQEEYESISFLTHSMGGLVTKSAITWMENSTLNKVKLVFFLSVPHIGAQIAKLGTSLLGDDPHLKDLELLNSFTTDLNQRFSQLKPPIKLIYQSGNQDIVVKRYSAIPANAEFTNTISTSDDHFSVLLIENRSNNLLLKRILRELNEVKKSPFLQPKETSNLKEVSNSYSLLYIYENDEKTIIYGFLKELRIGKELTVKEFINERMPQTYKHLGWPEKPSVRLINRKQKKWLRDNDVLKLHPKMEDDFLVLVDMNLDSHLTDEDSNFIFDLIDSLIGSQS